MDWKLTIGSVTKTLAEWGVEEVQARFTSLDADLLQFRRVGAAIDAAELCAYRDSIVLLRDGVKVFAGQRALVPGQANEMGEEQAYTFLGPWDWLARNPFRTQWTGGIGGVLQTVYTTHTIQRGSIQQILTAVINYAIARGAPMLLGTVDIATTPPIIEYTDKTCASVIRDVLQYAPDAVGWFDYATTPPTFHVRQRTHLTPVSLKLPTEQDQAAILIEQLRIVPRPDLQRPSVEITCEITNQVDGAEKFGFYRERWPLASTGFEDGVFAQTINLQGFSATHVTGYIEAATIESDSTTWWKNHLQKLADDRISNLAVVPGSIERTGLEGAGAANLLREIVDGQAAEWMVNPNGSDIDWDDEIISAKFNFDFADAGEQVLKFKSERFAVRLRTTNAPAGQTNYSTLESFDEADPVPVGLARYLYDSFWPLHYDVSTGTLELEVAGNVLPRHLLNVTNGKAEWTAMNAVVQEVVWNIDQGQTQITAGPPKHLTPSDLLALMKANRGRRRWTNPDTQTTGNLSGPSNVQMSRAGANNDGMSGLGTPSYFVVKDGTTRITSDAVSGRLSVVRGTTEILSDAAGGQHKVVHGETQIISDGAGGKWRITGTGNGSVTIAVGDAAGKEIKLREVDVCKDGTNKKMIVLGSEVF